LRRCERVRCGTTGAVLVRELVLYLARGCFHSPVYLGSSLSSLRRRVCTSGGISGALSDLSSASASLSPSFLSLPFSLAPSGVCAFSLGRGVPARLGCSSSSPMTNSGSNSEGSGPFPVGAALLLSPSLDLAVRFDGDRLRELERLGVELDRAGGVCGVVRCFACSSAIRASMAPRMRWGVHVSWVRAVVHVEITWSP
jgi:hypothetical protein